MRVTLVYQCLAWSEIWNGIAIPVGGSNMFAFKVGMKRCVLVNGVSDSPRNRDSRQINYPGSSLGVECGMAGAHR